MSEAGQGHRKDSVDQVPSEPPPLALHIRAAAEGERLAIVRGFLREEIGRIAQMGDGELDDGDALLDVGLTSMLAAELEYRVRKMLGVRLSSVNRPLDAESIDTLASLVLGLVVDPQPPPPEKTRR